MMMMRIPTGSLNLSLAEAAILGEEGSVFSFDALVAKVIPLTCSLCRSPHQQGHVEKRSIEQSTREEAKYPCKDCYQPTARGLSRSAFDIR